MAHIERPEADWNRKGLEEHKKREDLNMPCGKKDKPTYKTKKQAMKHGYITYGRYKTGAKKFRVYKVKDGWNVAEK